jgi:HlyD family secretion protein
MNKHISPTSDEIREALGITPRPRRRTWLIRILMLIGVMLLAGAVWYVYSLRSTEQQSARFETAPAEIADLVLTVSATGAVQPITQVDIGSALSGIVLNVFVDENATVKAGDTLAQLDTARLKAQRQSAAAKVKMAEAAINVAKATADQTRLTLDRQKPLGSRGIVAKEQIDTAIADAARADANVESALGQLSAATADLLAVDTDLAHTDIKSPIEGVVLKRAVEPGQTVAASLQAPVLFQIAQDLRHMKLEANVDEADIGAVREGQKATFTVDAYRDRNFPAVIDELSFAPLVVDGVVTYKAVLTADNNGLLLRPGMTATARIVVEEFKNALTVPNEALRYQPPRVEASRGFSVTQLFMPRFPRNSRERSKASADGMKSLYVLRDGAAIELRVKAGASDGKRTVISSGDIKAGDLVIVAQATAKQ